MKITYPAELPVSQRRDDIAAAIRDHQVVIVAGETGSGKTTQLPKICLELGRGVSDGLIGHTQPRRIAARTVAERIAEELGTPSSATPSATRCGSPTGPRASTLVKLMTDGILLAEMQRDRHAARVRHDHHRRGARAQPQHRLPARLPQAAAAPPARPQGDHHLGDDRPERFAEHFDGAPIIEVSGRTYPVEVRYRPLIELTPSDDDEDEAVIATRPRRSSTRSTSCRREGPGDVLVFLSGEREIRDTADALPSCRRRRAGIEIAAALRPAVRRRAAPGLRAAPAGRRVVLATNVAETSLTVPGIRYVVDPGTARISRYSARTKVQRLPIEPISQAIANQRTGRCGRVADGICIRLYSEEDFEARPEFTEPEILRTNLARSSCR